MLGGIVPVPVALGISDEHKHKLLRIARKLGKPFIYTDRKTLDRIGAFAGGAGEQATFDALTSRAFFAEQVDDISKAGQVHAVKPDDMAFIQFSSGSTSEPKGVVLTHRNILVNARGSGEAAHWNESDTCVTWMPLTHDMGLIGMHIMMFAHRMNNSHHAHGTVHPPAAAVDDILLAQAGAPSPARRISATATISRCSAIATRAISICPGCAAFSTARNRSRSNSRTNS